MLDTTLQQIAAITGGRATGDVRVLGAAYLDSRDPVPDGLFVALAGGRADGHDHVGTARAVLGTRPTARPTVVVPDVVVALGRLARHVVATRDTRVIAVTGSHGKTSVKEFLAAVLPDATATRGNQNNELGVPLTALRLPPTGGDLVLEVGARAVGHLTYLAGIAPPRISAVTALGLSHVGRFGSPELLARAKGELVEATSDLVVLNADDPRVLAMAGRTWARVVTFGARGDVATSGVRLDAEGRASFRLHSPAGPADVRLRVVGGHQVANAACAAAVALGAGVPLAQVVAGLERTSGPGEHRLQRLVRAHDGGVLLDDCYNASPASMAAAFATLAAVARAGHRVAALGPVRELGALHDRAHRAVAAAARHHGVEVVAVGPDAEPLGGTWVPDVAAAAGFLRERLTAADALLVKASRPSRLERLVAALT
ncbi:UDP-N-acetylmuramoyl-tripeptide--D-alanyl-D-alanine ligase [Kineococcus rhizosphaerae]|uniref:UDP-N-acetylmuramoyl-tripeptide--D-alanyl-D-alanine ligase n=1 Tax=Kineococcus rhizosphaerae TaxID=559628 RepID=A0A2T0R2Z1_9ACTN|nr:UDP-N-acetylmuramoyl-tripeptide--D-alanyl-D-alanine ligase [Kineococcus rhizosphaerae]PRY14172.1 UDP-N-acetylmuramoyl-tripeptide--D-alanyl-D-alanine ligase [Kineococcus rhizosphaerae]